MSQPISRAANRFHQRLLDVHANRHHLAGRLHLRAEGALAVHELVKRPLRDFRHDVVQRGLERGAGLARHGVLHFIQRIADGNLRGALGNRAARRLRRKGGGTADARVDLDDGIVERIGIERELAVAAALDFQRGDDVQRGAAEHLVLLVRQSQRGRNDDGVARMHADGSMFSIEQTAITLPSLSRMTSNSISFQPEMHFSTRICVIGDRRRPFSAISASSFSSWQMPPPEPPSVYAGRTITGSRWSWRTRAHPPPSPRLPTE